jgi:hypothetical protein
MPDLNFKTPFDELGELRKVLTTQQIAELTGLRRETISRARPDSRFQRRTEKALGDLYLVVTRMRSVIGDDLGQLAAVLRRPQEELGGRSIAELLREGQVEVVLGHLPPVAPAQAKDPGLEESVAAVLAEDPELAARLGAIEAALIAHFGPTAEVERNIISEYDDPEGEDELYLRVRIDLPFDEKIDRLADFLHREEDLLGPVAGQLTIGFL